MVINKVKNSKHKNSIMKHKVSLNLLILFGIILIVVFSFATYALFYKSDNCDSWKCFNNNLIQCKRSNFIGGNDEVFEYGIEGISSNSCGVNVKLLQGEFNNQDSIALEGLSMFCEVPFGVAMLPESDIGACHGLLKEGLQDLVIEKLHTYLIQNLGKINLELFNISN